MEQGKSWLEAVRALKRFIARGVWRVWQRHYAHNPTPKLTTVPPLPSCDNKPQNRPEMNLILT